MLICSTDEHGVSTVTLNRPEVMNALNSAMIETLVQTLKALREDSATRAVLITGAGRAFCAGADLQDSMMNLDAPAAERSRQFLESSGDRVQAVARALEQLGKPTVTAVNGAAVGGGAAIALGAHVVLAGESAYFSWPFTAKLGLTPDVGASWHLMRRLGAGRALPLALLGERLEARQAADWGLIWRCVSDTDLLSTAQEIAQRLAAGAPRAQAVLPALLYGALENDLDAQLDRERDVQSALVGTADFVEAVTAFREKRQPRFQGR